MAAAKTVPGVYFVAGSDEAAVKKAAAQLAEKLAPGADAFGLETIDGAVETVDAACAVLAEAIQAALTMPFLGGSKLVWLKSAAMLSDTAAGKSESVQALVEKLCTTLQGGLPDGVQFLLSAVSPDKRRTTYKTLTKIAQTTLHDLPDLGFRATEEDVIDWTASVVRKRGLIMEPGAVTVLAASVGVDTGQLDNELSKLESAFGTSHRITEEEVRMLVPRTRESGIFDLSDAVAKRDLPLALTTLRQLFSQGEKGVGILLAAIVPTVRNLLLAKDLLVRHKLPAPGQPQSFAGALNRLSDTETSHLPRKKDGTLNTYPLGIAAMNSARFSLDELESGFRACATANQQLLSGAFSDEVVLVRLLLGFLSRKN